MQEALRKINSVFVAVVAVPLFLAFMVVLGVILWFLTRGKHD